MVGTCNLKLMYRCISKSDDKKYDFISTTGWYLQDWFHQQKPLPSIEPGPETVKPLIPLKANHILWSIPSQALGDAGAKITPNIYTNYIFITRRSLRYSYIYFELIIKQCITKIII